MEWSKRDLQINYKKTIRQADELEQLAEQMMELSDDDMENMIETVSSIWKGESGNLYVQRGEYLNTLICQHAKSLQRTAVLLRNSAENMYHAELRIIELANRRWW